MIFRHLLNMQSHPTWVRGLKLLVHRYNRKPHYVAPYVGAWIETISFIWLFEDNMSHPTWVRGLKQSIVSIFGTLCGRTLRGCVD